MKLDHSQKEDDEGKETFKKKTAELITHYEKKLMENDGRLREALRDLNMKRFETSETLGKVMARTKEVNVLVATLSKKEEEIYEQEMKISGIKELLN